MINAETADITLCGNGGTLSLNIRKVNDDFHFNITGGSGRMDVKKPEIYFECSAAQLLALSEYIKGVALK